MGWKDLKEGLWGANDPIKKVRRQRQLSKVQKYAEAFADVARAVNDVREKWTLRNVLAIGAVGLSHIVGINYVTVHGADYCYGSYPSWVVRSLQRHLTSLGKLEAMSIGEDKCYVYQGLDDILIMLHGSDCSLFMPRRHAVEADEVDRMRSFVARTLWECVGSRAQLVRTDSKDTELVSYAGKGGLQSEQADALTEEYKSFHREGFTRSYLLEGPPGTGKTRMAEYMAENMQGFKLYSDEGVSFSEITSAIDLLRPDVVVIDDYDHYRTSSSPGSLSRIAEHTKLFIITVNNLKAFNPAEIRPERFDRVVKVVRVTSPKDRFPELSPRVAEFVDEWPLAYIEELRKRQQVYKNQYKLTGEALEERVWQEAQALTERVTKNNCSSEYDD